MKEIILVDYVGICDKDGQAVGHSAKVLLEYSELLREKFSVSAYVAPCIAEAVEGNNFKQYLRLKYNIVSTEKNKVSTRILDKFKELYNIHQVFRKYSGSNNSILWFYRIDFFLFLYLFLMPVKKTKIVCLLFQQDFDIGVFGRVLNYIYRRSLRRVDGIIFTSDKFNEDKADTLYMPDYYYDSEKYEKYRSLTKQEKVVCLGTMSYQKELEKLVGAFNKLNYPLEISGVFYQQERYRNLKESASSNILIQNGSLTEDMYYHKLAEAKYAILPYDTKLYKDRTSGVLLESLFVGTIPIAPDSILEANQIPGIGYKTLDEIKSEDFKKGHEKIYSNMEALINDKYDLQQVKNKLIQFFYKLQ